MPAPSQPPPGDGQPAVSQGQVGAGPALDGTTRYLCAAAHLDEEFCDAAVAEFLVEPVRAIPPSPGVDSAVVLREAVAAQTRRCIRDAVLLTLLLVLALVNFIGVISWVVTVAVAAGLLAAVAARDRNMAANAAQLLGPGRNRRMTANAAQLLAAGAGHNRPIWALVVVVTGVVFLAVFPTTVAAGLSQLLSSPGGSADQEVPTEGMWPTWLISGLLLLVLLVDEFTVAKLKASSFRRDRFDPDAGRAPSEWERLVRSLGRNSFRTELQRVARSDESLRAAGQADVVVYRGYNPFDAQSMSC